MHSSRADGIDVAQSAQHGPSVLLIDDEQDLLDSLRQSLGRKGFQVKTVLSGREGLALLLTVRPDVVLVDLRMPQMDGLAVLHAVREQDANLPVILITAFATVPTALAAVKEGAFDYLAKPFSNDEVELVLRRALDHRRLIEENRRLQTRARAKEAFAPIIGESPPMRRLLKLMGNVAATDVNVLIVGECGTGKELVARGIHAASLGWDQPFAVVDCGALPEDRLERELFGYEKGAFTGATHTKAGLLQWASGGTLFLDEVSELALPLQAKLLHAIQERTVRRSGPALRAVDCRIISATSCDLEARVRDGGFRDDLYCRLKVVTVELPPLRVREGDIPLLAQHFFDELKSETAKHLEGISSAAMMILESYSWPGNVRELRNVIERAITLSESTQITLLDLPSALLEAVEGPEESGAGSGDFQHEKQALITRFERDYVERTLRETDGNVAEAARRAGMERPAFHRLMRKYAIDAAPYRSGQQ